MSRAENLSTENFSFRRYVKISVIFHVLLFLFLTIQATFFTEAPIQFEKAIRVDIVGLPDKVQELPPAAAPVAEAPPAVKPTPAPQPTPPKTETAKKPEPVKPTAKLEPVKQKLPTKPKDPEAINLDKSRNKQKQALEKLKQMEALEAIQQEVESDNKKKIVQAAAAAQVKFKGNVLSSGSDLTGVNKLQAENYTADVYRHIMDNWSAPAYFKNRNLKTHVMVRFDENGNVLAKEIVKSSGNPAFDELVLNAIQKSSPVPAPPAKFSKIAAVEGFLFRFSPDSE